ncbi:uncharacterized protein LOC133653125 [Entelurus aequoreus]|uniref:uncharacterized protein LOC133653125 n=1 Tax=Entelurus aequoreus TaxID=161455 RepID=UPI002B1DD148|nr:uncharacterized protein LOC133653125 [Entelurus aequoreus]
MEELLWEARQHCDELTKETSHLRAQADVSSQEVSDLQEALQWKEKKITALEREKELYDIIRMEKDKLKVEVINLRDALKRHTYGIPFGVTVSREMGFAEAEDQVSNSFASQLAMVAPSSRQTMLGNTGDKTSRRCQIHQNKQSLGFICASNRTQAPNDSKKMTRKKGSAGRKIDNKRRANGHLGKSLSGLNGRDVLPTNRTFKKQSDNTEHEWTSPQSPEEASRSKHQFEGHTVHQHCLSYVWRTSDKKLQKTRLTKLQLGRDAIVRHRTVLSRSSLYLQKTHHVTSALSQRHKDEKCMETLEEERKPNCLEEYNKRSSSIKELLGQLLQYTTLAYDIYHWKDPAINQQLTFSTPSKMKKNTYVEPSFPVSLLSQEDQDLPATHELEVRADTSEIMCKTCQKSNCLKRNRCLTDLVFVDSYFAPEDFITRHQTSSERSAAAASQSQPRNTFFEHIKILSVPHRLLMDVREGKLLDQQHSGQLMATHMPANQEPSADAMDSCEEASEETEVPSASEDTSETGSEKAKRNIKKHKNQCKLS